MNDNFVVDGQYYMVRCPVCQKENYIGRVASGVCAWCNYSEPLKKQLEDIVKGEE